MGSRKLSFGRIPLSSGRLGYTPWKYQKTPGTRNTPLSLVYGWLVQQARWQLETFAMDYYTGAQPQFSFHLEFTSSPTWEGSSASYGSSRDPGEVPKWPGFHEKLPLDPPPSNKELNSPRKGQQHDTRAGLNRLTSTIRVLVPKWMLKTVWTSELLPIHCYLLPVHITFPPKFEVLLCVS